MIYKYNDFILDKQFESILFEDFNILESKEKRVDWDYTEEDEKPITFEWDLSKPNTYKSKLKNFLSKLPKEKIKYYFYKLLQKVKNMPKKIRKKIVITYSLVFLSFVSIDYLIPEKPEGDLSEERVELINEFEEEIKDIKLKSKNNSTSNRLSKFEKAQGIVKQVEAGYSADRKDRGNFVKTPYGKRFLGTNHGISAPILADYMGKLPTKEDMKNLSYETALKIFKKKYWNPQNLSYFSDQNVANIIYDACVNQGINGTKKILRKVYRENNIDISNSENPFNKSFIKKVNNIDQEKVFNDIKKQRKLRYKSSITYKTHGEGWLSRLSSIKYENKF